MYSIFMHAASHMIAPSNQRIEMEMESTVHNTV